MKDLPQVSYLHVIYFTKGSEHFQENSNQLLFADPVFVKDIEHDIKERKRIQSSLERPEREWYNIMNGDLHRELIKSGGFLTNYNILLFKTNGVHAFNALKDEIWPLLL